MKNSSVPQLAFDFEAADDSDANTSGARVSSPDPTPFQSSLLKLPDFGRYPPLYAVTARIAGRINASAIPEEEHKALLAERQSLLDKRFNNTITRNESNRLEYIRWTLDRIEDARDGQVLEVLESAVGQYENFLKDLHSLADDINQALSRKK